LFFSRFIGHCRIDAIDAQHGQGWTVDFPGGLLVMAAARRSRNTRAPQTIVVTGAAGGVGRKVTMALLDAGYAVLAIDRQPVEAAHLSSAHQAHPHLRWLVLDLEAPLDQGLFEGATAVVHAAGLVGLSEPYDALRRSNVDMVEALARAAAAAKVEHFVHLSCASIYGGDARVRTEQTEIEPHNAYERSKVESEEALWRSADPMAWTILRLASVYGPGCTTMGAGLVTLPPILRDFVRYLPGLSGGPRTNWCHVDDAAGAVLTVLAQPEARHRIFNVADRTALSFGEALTSLVEAYGMEPGPSLPFPNSAIWAVLSPLIDHEAAFDVFRKALRYRWRRIQQDQGLASPLRPRVDRRALFYVRKDAVLVTGALEELGWRQRWPDFREGIVDTVRGYQAMGWLPRLDWTTREALEDPPAGRSLHYGERYDGSIESPGQDPRTVNLDLEVEWHQWPRLLGRTEGFIEGTLRLEEDSPLPVKGTVTLTFSPKPHLDYQFGFVDPVRGPHRFEGRRTLEGHKPLERWMVLDGKVFDARAVSYGDVRLNLKKLEGLTALPRLLADGP
jgi:nucleoside-diphosphate-sugar epimerase